MASDFEEYLRFLHRSQLEIPSDNLSSTNFNPVDNVSAVHANHSNDTYLNFPGIMRDLLPEELPDSLRSLFTVFYVIIMLLAVTGNATTVLVIAVNREMRTVTNIFLLSLAISDALIAVINMPVQLVFYMQNEWTMGAAMCKFSPYLQGVVIVTSILTLTALALDRYYAICHPLRARHVHTISRAVILASSIWALALLLVIPQLFIQRLEPRIAIIGEASIRLVSVCVEYFSYDGLAIAYTTVFYVVLYVFPVLTMFATYGTIATKLWRRRPIGERTDSQRESDRRLHEKQRIVRMLVVIVVMFAVSWFPFFTVQVYLLFEEATSLRLQQHAFRVAVAFFQLLGYSNSCVNPIVYCFMNDSFQKNFFRTLWCRWMRTNREPDSSSKGRRRRSSCTDAAAIGGRINGGATTLSTHNSALDHTTTTV